MKSSTGQKLIRLLLAFVSFGTALPVSAADPLADEIVVSTTIQAAVDAARPGATIRVPPGRYRENVLVSKNDLTIEGEPGAVLDGAGLAGDTGIEVAPVDPTARIIDFKLSGLQIQNYSQNGVLLVRVDHFKLTQGKYNNNSEYGIFPILSSDGLIESNQVSGSDDTGIYVGQSSNVLVKHNRVSDSTVRIEIENSSNISVVENSSLGNCVGILVDVLPGLDVTRTTEVEIIGNVLRRNNRLNPVTDPSDLLSQLPIGLGLLNLGGDDVIIKNNIVTQNVSAGIAVAQLPAAIAALDPRIDPFPDDNQVLDNVSLRNGSSPDPKLAPLPGVDLLWDFSGSGNCWAHNFFETSFPSPLPACHQASALP